MTVPSKRQPHGRTVRRPSGYRAYVPDPLPPRLAWSDALAARCRGRTWPPDPHLLIRPFVRREAVLSSRISFPTRLPFTTTLPSLLIARKPYKNSV